MLTRRTPRRPSGRVAAATAGLILAGALLGCSSYYRVTDPVSGSTYYTQKVERLHGGSVRFVSARSDATVTLEESEVTPISKDEFNNQTGGGR